MKISNIHHLSRSAVYALIASTTAIALLVAAFFAVEPVVGHTANPFTIKQTISDETSFLVEPSNVTMDGTITGVTGGTANGSTTFAVQSNNDTGYTVSIKFDYQSGTYNSAMVGDTTLSEAIRDFDDTAGGGEPVQTFTASTAAQFGYNVTSVNSGDTDQSFWNNAGTCNSVAGTDDGTCWKAPSSTDFLIVDRGSSAVTGATSTIYFKVVVPSGSSPAVTADTYTATATLTLVTQ